MVKPWKIHHVAGKLNEVADSLSRKLEGHPEQEEAFEKRKLCKLGGYPDCEFFKKKLDKCRDEGFDDSEGAPESTKIPVDHDGGRDRGARASLGILWSRRGLRLG
jgi:hypothetical protein